MRALAQSRSRSLVDEYTNCNCFMNVFDMECKLPPISPTLKNIEEITPVAAERGRRRFHGVSTRGHVTMVETGNSEEKTAGIFMKFSL